MDGGGGAFIRFARGCGGGAGRRGASCGGVTRRRWSGGGLFRGGGIGDSGYGCMRDLSVEWSEHWFFRFL